MILKIVKWFKNLCKNNPGVRKTTVQALSAFPAEAPAITSDGSQQIKMYLIDPSEPNFLVEEPVQKTRLPINAVGDFGGGFPYGSIQQQATASKAMVNHALKYMISLTPKNINNWSSVNVLTILPRAGKDINAYYDRGALKFFFFGDKKLNKNIYACDSRSVVIHEFGHAYLDILRPDFWSTQCSEIWAFHEAFGDMTAILENLQYDELIENAIHETDGNLLKSNIITRLAVEMGQGVYHLTNGKDGELPNCLRDISIVYKYTIPENLPQVGPDNKIINECHSFSRIFSGAFYEIIIKMSEQNIKNGMKQIDAVKNARDIAAHYLLAAVIDAPATIRFFDAIAKHMLHIDANNGGKFQTVMGQVFLNRNILQESIKMLDVVDMKDVVKNIKDPFEVQTHGNTKVVRIFTNRKIRLNKMKKGIMALSNNPLFDLEIDVPNQVCHYFDENQQLTDTVQAQDSEIIDAAYNCLDFLHKNNLVGSHTTALFEENNGALVRKQIVCLCGKPNYCDKNAPEYGKPWKPANNAGCVGCHNKNCKPQSCDCDNPEPAKPVKTGCYTSMKSGSVKSYKVGQSISRKVC
jgi:hypothetical protein